MQAINNFLTPVYRELDDGNLFLALFLDYKKAFDCVPHEILLTIVGETRGVSVRTVR